MTDSEWEELYKKTEKRVIKALKIIAGITSAMIVIIAVFWMSFVYVTKYKISTVSTSVSPDGMHALTLQAVGEAAWPFGPAEGRLLLKENQKEVSKTNFILFDDGGSIRDEIWSVMWHEDYVEVILSGDEQSDEQVLLYYDGRKESNQLTNGACADVEEEQETIPEPNVQDKAAPPYAKYEEVLEQIMIEHTDPNGREYHADEQWAFENNKYAILDVDGDGRQELIFCFHTGNMASMCEVVYDYDVEKEVLREELAAWVDSTYYSNGFVKVSDSHNHGKDPEEKGIWPYTLYQYDADTDTYRLRYYVTSWDGQINSENFLRELDTDGDGILYYILEDGMAVEDTDAVPINRQEYDAWVKETLPEELVIDMNYYPMTEESIKEMIK